MADKPLIAAYRKDTGEVVHIPGHWLDDPTLGAPFAKTPRTKAAEKAADAAPTKTPAAGESSKGK